MRFSLILVAIAAFLVAGEAFSDSSQIAKVGLTVGPRQRLLRAQYTEVEFGMSENEMKEMMKMMTDKVTKEDFAKKLKITKQIDEIINKHAPDLHAFMQTSQYKKYANYMNFLNDMAKTSEYGALVQEIKAKSRKQVALTTLRKNTQTTQVKWKNVLKLLKGKRIGK